MSEECLTYSDVSNVEVIVSLEYLPPVLERLIVQAVILIRKSLKQDVAVLSSSVNSKRLISFIDDEHFIALINDSLNRGNVSGLNTVITEGEQQIAVLVISEDLRSFLVDDRPCSLGTYGNVNDLGRIRISVSLLVAYLDFTGRRIKSVSSHDVGAGSIELLDRSVVS